MRIQDIMEAINSGDLTKKSQQAIIRLIDDFGKSKQAELAAVLGMSETYTQMVEALAAYREESDDRNMNRLDALINKFRNAIQKPNTSVLTLVQDFRNQLSDELTKIVIERVENDFGKIEPVTDTSDITGYKNNLWWLEAIAVEIRDDSGSGSNTAIPQISPEQAKKINMPVEIPTDPRFREAIESSKDAELTNDGVVIDLVRFQKQEQIGGTALRTGVFYLPKSSSSVRHYNKKDDNPSTASYGGTVRTAGKTLLKKPLEVMAGTGGKVPSKAYDKVKGKGSYLKLEKATRSLLSQILFDRNAKYEIITMYLDDFGGNSDMTDEIIEYSRHGNQLYYALTEHVIVHAVRNAGYDSIIGFWKSGDSYTITEVIDLREVENPVPGKEGTLHPKFESLEESVGSNQFKTWFGNSKVVDSNGNPLVVYHGTGADVSEFQGMVWASAGKNLPHEYAAMRGDEFNNGNPSIMPLYMKIEHPFNADIGLSKTVTIGDMITAMLEQADSGRVEANRDRISSLLDIIQNARRREESGPHYSRHDFWNETVAAFGKDGAAALLEMFKLCGFDGIMMIENGEQTYGAFSPKQVKSIYNRGTYSDSSHISESGGGFFTAMASKNHVNSHTLSKINPDSMISLIVVFADDSEIWNLISHAVLYEIEEDAFGESTTMGDYIYDDHQIVREMVNTFVHETVHLIQNTRAMMSRQTKGRESRPQKYGSNTKVYVPAPNTKRPTSKIAGKRGSNPSNAIVNYMNGGSAPSIDEWIAYLSHDIEIEAHASQIASTMYQNYFNHSYRHMRRSWEANDAVNSAIDDVRYSDEIYGNSYYNQVILPEIVRIKKAGVKTNRDKRLVQVWNRLRKKIIQHLESYRPASDT